jgi:hypothetical protein
MTAAQDISYQIKQTYMKKALLALTFIISLTAGKSQCPLGSIGSVWVAVDTAGVLKNYYANNRSFAYVYGRDSVNDNLGGAYRFSDTSTMPHDGYLSIQPGYGSACPMSIGRWLRANQSSLSVPQGTVFTQPGGLKILMGTTTTSAGADSVRVNLTWDNTITGIPIFRSTVVLPQSQIDQSGFPAGTKSKPAGGRLYNGNKIASFKYEVNSIVTITILGVGTQVLTPALMPGGHTVTYLIIGY